jgi:hypothetical protein
MIRTATLSLLVALAACGASRAGDRGRATVDQNIVLGDELRRFGAANLLDALRSMRPRWFRPTSPAFGQSGSGPVVYLDGRRFGATNSLGLINIPIVVSARYYSASEAQGRFGPGHLQGVIEVTTGPVP